MSERKREWGRDLLRFNTELMFELTHSSSLHTHHCAREHILGTIDFRGVKP